MSDGLEFNAVLDNILGITERNLNMQAEFLKNIAALNTRFDTIDRDHKEIMEDLKPIIANSFTVVNKMTAASNDKIIDMLTVAKDSKGVCDTEWSTNFVKIIDCLDNIKGINTEVADIIKKIDRIDINVTDTADKDKWIKKVLGTIAILTIGFQIIFGIYATIQKDDFYTELRKEIMEDVKDKLID